MTISSREEVLEILRMPDDRFRELIMPEAEKTAEKAFHRTLRVTSMLPGGSGTGDRRLPEGG